MKFTAIDFETANFERSSACQVGIVVVENNKIVNEFSSFIKPEPYYFTRRCMDVHGIDKSMVKYSPTFKDLWPEISGFIEKTDCLVAHNAVFDRSVLKNCLDFYNLPAIFPEFYCTYQEARKKVHGLPNYKLSTVSDYFGIDLNHHEALSDARAAAKIAIELGLM